MFALQHITTAEKKQTLSAQDLQLCTAGQEASDNSLNPIFVLRHFSQTPGVDDGNK